MKYFKTIILIMFIAVLSGCSNKKTVCTFDKEENGDAKTHVSITLYSNNDVVEKEEIESEYVFKSKEDADKNYKAIEKTIEQDKSLKIEQSDEIITVHGEKDVTDMKYDKKSKMAYYEQLGYTCK